MPFLQRESLEDVIQTWLIEEESLGRGWRYMASTSRAGGTGELRKPMLVLNCVQKMIKKSHFWNRYELLKSRQQSLYPSGRRRPAEGSLNVFCPR